MNAINAVQASLQVKRLSKIRLVYGLEVGAIAIATLLGVHPSLLSLLAIVSLPALVFGVIGITRPDFFDPLEYTDPRRGRRIYLHACGILCSVAVLYFVVVIAISIGDGSLTWTSTER